MNKINDGGPAFPQNLSVGPSGDVYQSAELFPGSHGMTLRDYFAGQALAGMFHHDGWINTGDGSQREVAFRAYQIADAMMNRRQGGGTLMTRLTSASTCLMFSICLMAGWLAVAIVTGG